MRYLVFPTRYPNEEQPIGILEVMGNGVFVVSTNHAGIPNMVQDGVNRIVLQDKQIEKDNLIKKLYTCDNNQLLKICNTKRVCCKEQYSQKTYVENMGKCFAKV